MSVASILSNPMDFTYLQRVKVYRLNDGGKWDDKGTGHVSLEYLERSEAVGLVVIDEENNQTLLIHRISADDIYRRQEDTIISWTDPEVATDLALSFQETMSCSYIWDQICSVQRTIQFPSVGALDTVPRAISDELEHSGISQDDGLPNVELSTLPQLVKAVSEVPHSDRDRVAALILRNPNYIRKIIELFKMCEDLDNLEGLHMLFKTVKGIIALNDSSIFDDIFSEEFIMDIVGALEYDPELPVKQKHRAFLKEQVAYKEVVPIRDPHILAKIHQTYRIGFIKDVILPRALDDQTFGSMNSIMLFNNVAVLSALQNNTTFMNELFSKLWSPETTERGRKDLILFVQEFCNLSKHLQPSVRNQLLGSLVSGGLFDIVCNTLQSSDESIRNSGSDILVVMSNQSPPLLRAFLIQQQGQTLFNLLVKGMLNPAGGGLQSQLLEIMRMLLDSDTMDPTQPDKFLDVFYEKYIDQLVEVLTAGCPLKGASAEQSKQPPPVLGGTVLKGEITPMILMSICELMCFCVLHHRYRIKYCVMRNHVVEKILCLTRRREKYLVVAAIRFLRTCIALKDDFYNRYLVKNNLFQPVIQSFLANGNRYNLLNSAVLELIDYIRRENITILITHLVENFSEKLSSIDYVDTFQALKLKYEQSMEVLSANSRDAGGAVMSGGPDHGSQRLRDGFSQAGPVPDARKRRDERALDKDEEDYFNEDSDDEEDTASAKVSPPRRIPLPSSATGNGSVLVDVPFRDGPFGLVDYEDEDEDGPTAVGIGKEGSSDRKSGVLLPPLTVSEPIWPETEESPKRKVNASKDSPEIEEFVIVKRKKPEHEDSSMQSDLALAREVEETPSQVAIIKESVSPTSGEREAKLELTTPEENHTEQCTTEAKLTLESDLSSRTTAGTSSVMDTEPSEGKCNEEHGQSSDTSGCGASGSESEYRNGFEDRLRGSDQGSDLCNGVVESSEKVEKGPPLLSLGSETKLGSLGNEIRRSGSQPSSDLYTVG